MAKKKIIPEDNTSLYLQYESEINMEIKKRCKKWTLTVVPSINYEDVAQIVKLHIFSKIHLYDPNKEIFVKWVNVVITNRIINLLRNLYSNFSPPCVKCPANEGNNLCRIYGVKSSACSIYENWIKTKKDQYDTRITDTIENHTNHIQEISDQKDISVSVDNFHKCMMEKYGEASLKGIIYRKTYVENFADEELLNYFVGLSAVTGKKYPSSRQIKNIQKDIIQDGKELAQEQDF